MDSSEGTAAGFDSASRRDEVRLSESQLRCLVSPVRKQLLSTFLLDGPCTVLEASTRLGRPTKSLYYHVRAMLGAGLLRRAGARGAGRLEEVLFDTAADRFLLDPEARSSGYRAQAARSVEATLRLASREYSRASETGSEVFVVRVSTRLSESDRDEVRRRLRSLIEFAKERDDPARGRRFALTALAVELETGEPVSAAYGDLSRRR